MQNAQKTNDNCNYNDLAEENNLRQQKAIDEIAKISGPLGLNLVEIGAILEQGANSHASQIEKLEVLNSFSNEVSQANTKMSLAGIEAQSAIEKSAINVHQRVKSAIEASHKAQSWQKGAESSAQLLSDFLNSFENIFEVAKSIESIAANTNLLALNATIEAARAGEAGRGFAVVAREVKSLSAQSKEASVNIQGILNSLNSQLENLRSNSKSNIELALTLSGELHSQSNSMAEILVAFEQVGATISEISSNATQIEDRSNYLNREITEITREIREFDEQLQDGVTRISAITLDGEKIMQLSVNAGAKGDDEEIIELAKLGAHEIETIFQTAIQNGEISISNLFDSQYRPIANSNPQQFTTEFVCLTDKYLPAIQENILERKNTIVFCAAIDRNGFLPTHNKKFSQPQRPNDPSWNLANCRNRRIFNDRVGLKSGQNSKGALVQAYRRDMGNGQFVMMKDISFPIFVNGEHWGGFRLGIIV